MEKMKKNDFEMRYNTESEEWFVIKVKDELTKNHKNIENMISGVMPENKTDRMCPLKSFRTYIEHLNPESEYMWQYTLDKINLEFPDIWYSKKHFGKNPLSTFMSDLSKETELSRIYTNHSIRSTGITVLTNAKFSNADIMSVSGHKSVQSLIVFQKTDIKKRMEMGKALSGSMVKDSPVKSIEAPPKKLGLPSAPSTLQLAVQQSESAIMPKENVMGSIIPFEANFEENDDIPDFDLLNAICDIEEKSNQKELNAVTPTTSAVTSTSNVFNQIP